MNWYEMTRGQRVRVAVEARGLTMEQMAQRAGISRFTLSHVINGRLPGHVDLWTAVSVVLGVRIGWLLEGEGDIWRPSETQKTVEASSPPPHRAPTLPLSRPLSPQKRKRKG